VHRYLNTWNRRSNIKFIVSIPVGPELKFNGRKVDFKLDAGADVTVIPPSLHQSLKPTPLLSKTTKLPTGPCKQKLNCLGTFTAELQMQENVTTEQVYVIPDLKRALLGRAVAERLKLVSRLDSLSTDEYKAKLNKEAPQVVHGSRGHEGKLLHYPQSRC